MRLSNLHLCTVALLTLAGACSRADGAADKSVKEDTQSAVATKSLNEAASDIPLATRPTDDCGWIPTAEVEAIVGKLAAPPHRGDGGCIYTLEIPQKVLDERAKLDKVRAAIAKMPGADNSLKKAKAYDTYGFSLDVQLREDGYAETVGKTVGRMFGADDGNDSVRKSHGGWDAPGMPYGGRIGHVRVSVTPIASDFDLPRDKLDTVAAHVRDRIPDRPFAMTDNSARETRDPCTLLSRQDAEAVLGPLLVPPYRTGNDGPLADAQGPSCAYYTAGHHVLILTPHWTGGKTNLAANRGVSGLIASVTKDGASQSADTLEGPWDQAAMSPDGRLVLLKGDRALEIGYRVSSTDQVGALKLARIAVEHLAAAKP